MGLSVNMTGKRTVDLKKFARREETSKGSEKQQSVK